MPASVPTNCSSVTVPTIVYSSALIGQTSSITSEVVFTSATSGFFRLTVGGRIYLPATQAVTISMSAYGVSLATTDGNAGSSGVFISVPVDVELTAGTEVSFSAILGEPGSNTFDAFACIEQLA